MNIFYRNFIGQISAKQQAFTGLAHYYESLVCKDEKEIGPELAHLTKAQDLLSAGIASQLYPSELAAAQRAYQAAKKDNDFIYHERIPDVKTLPGIGKAPLAKPLPVSHPMSRGFKVGFLQMH